MWWRDVSVVPCVAVALAGTASGDLRWNYKLHCVCVYMLVYVTYMFRDHQ